MLSGREIDDRDQPGSTPVAVISERQARTYFENEKRDLEIVGVSGNLRYGGLKNEVASAMTVFVPVSQFSSDRVTYVLRTAADPLRFVQSVHEIVREADSRGRPARLESVWLWAAQRGAVVWMVLRRVLLLAAVGLAISVPAALGASRLVLAGVVLLSAAIFAGYAPARRASRS